MALILAGIILAQSVFMQGFPLREVGGQRRTAFIKMSLK